MKIGSLFGGLLAGTVGTAVGAAYEFVKEEKRLDKMESKSNKFEFFYKLLITWVEMKQEGKSLVEYFEYNNIKSIAVYGMRELGERLVKELEGSDIEIKYIIDQNAGKIDTKYPKCTPDSELEPVDAIVVTAIYYFQDIEEKLSKKVDYQIISLEDVVYGMM